jgi:uncharacterized protein (DUF433 family)
LVTDDLPRDDLFAATPQTAARLAGVTVRQLDYWRRVGLVEPAVVRRLSPRNEVRLSEIIMLEEVRADLRRAAAQPDRTPGRIVKRRRVLASKPTFAGTRVPVSAVRAFLDRGASEEQILAAYPQLTEADIVAVRADRAVAG